MNKDETKIATISHSRGLYVTLDKITDAYRIISIKMGDEALLRPDKDEARHMSEALAKAARKP